MPRGLKNSGQISERFGCARFGPIDVGFRVDPRGWPRPRENQLATINANARSGATGAKGLTCGKYPFRTYRETSYKSVP